MRKALLFIALCLSLSGIGLSVASWNSDKIQVVFFRDLKGVNHSYWLTKPVWRNDTLALRSAVIELASTERVKTLQEKGDVSFVDSFLEAASVGYTDSGSLCYITARSGGRVYYCGNCGGAGCAQVRAIQ